MDTLKFEGIIKTYQLPHDCSSQSWRKLPFSEKAHYQVHETHNILTTKGLTYLLSYIGSQAVGTTPAFNQWFALGTTPINSVLPGDTSVPGEVLRVQPNSATVVGTQIDLGFGLSTSQINGVQLANAGLFGVSATSTPGSGILMTHALYTFLKVTNQQYQIDYLLNLQ